MRRLLRLAAAAAVAACAAGMLSVDAAPAGRHGPPATMLGLNVQPENVKGTVAEDTRPLWVDHVRLYSLRNGKELTATLEIAHFKAGAPWRSADFQSTIASSLGSSVPAVVRLGGVAVYLTNLRSLRLAAWFRDGSLFILAVRQTFGEPKSLIREALGVTP